MGREIEQRPLKEEDEEADAGVQRSDPQEWSDEWVLLHPLLQRS